MTTSDLPKPPPGLSARARRLWADVLADHELAPAEMELLRSACEVLDRADAAAVVVKREGVTVLDRYGSPKAHPAADIETRSRSLFAALIRQLDVKLHDESSSRTKDGYAKPGPKPRPPRPFRSVG